MSNPYHPIHKDKNIANTNTTTTTTTFNNNNSINNTDISTNKSTIRRIGLNS